LPQAEVDGLPRKTGVVFLAGEALLLGGRHGFRHRRSGPPHYRGRTPIFPEFSCGRNSSAVTPLKKTSVNERSDRELWVSTIRAPNKRVRITSGISQNFFLEREIGVIPTRETYEAHCDIAVQTTEAQLYTTARRGGQVSPERHGRSHRVLYNRAWLPNRSRGRCRCCQHCHSGLQRRVQCRRSSSESSGVCRLGEWLETIFVRRLVRRYGTLRAGMRAESRKVRLVRFGRNFGHQALCWRAWKRRADGRDYSRLRHCSTRRSSCRNMVGLGGAVRPWCGWSASNSGRRAV